MPTTITVHADCGCCGGGFGCDIPCCDDPTPCTLYVEMEFVNFREATNPPFTETYTGVVTWQVGPGGVGGEYQGLLDPSPGSGAYAGDFRFSCSLTGGLWGFIGSGGIGSAAYGFTGSAPLTCDPVFIETTVVRADGYVNITVTEL